VKPPPFLYARPRSVEEALALLAQHGDESKVLAGGQSLIPLLNFRLARPSVLIDLGRVEGLDTITEDANLLRIGAMVRQRHVEQSPLVARSCPLLIKALRHVGHVQIRNRGTVGGSMAHADPAAELPTVALALGAEMEVIGPGGRRTIAPPEFFDGPFMTTLQPDELLLSVAFPSTAGRRTAFVEISRRAGDFAVAGVAAVLAGDRTVAEVSLAALGVGPSATRLAAAEDTIRGRSLDPPVLRDAATAAAREVSPFDDVHADAEYRREAVGVLVARALLRAS
jgi:aerobic carbon-monoxide dehydrogenase medium subunit